jgi:hypothetical protein
MTPSLQRIGKCPHPGDVFAGILTGGPQAEDVENIAGTAMTEGGLIRPRAFDRAFPVMDVDSRERRERFHRGRAVTREAVYEVSLEKIRSSHSRRR